MQLKEVDQRRGFGHSSSSSSQDIVVIYNRVPKTGSTSFVGVAYDLCKQNGFHNVSHWNTMKPALYHGHLAFVDFARFGGVH
ncbi:Heparin sulfate O-sulfotransferase [Blattella germanica]|nr:Heparin sulfate O-sulfotransferase [Blattella germanica]